MPYYLLVLCIAVFFGILARYVFAADGVIITGNALLDQILTTGVIVAIVAAIVGMVARHLASKAAARLVERFETEESRNNFLVQHPFFAAISRAMTSDIYKIDIGDNSSILRDMLLVKFRTWRDGMKDFVTDPTTLRMEPKAMLVANMDMIQRVIASYEAEWRAMGIPERAITVFGEWHTPQAILCFEASSDAVLSPFAESNKQRLDGMLNAHAYLVRDTIHDMEKALTSMGSLLDEYAKNKNKLP